MRDPGWLNKVISGAPGCHNFRTETLVRFANVLGISSQDRRRLAKLAERPFAAFAQTATSPSLEAISMRRAVLLMSTSQPLDAAFTIRMLTAAVPNISLRLSRVFGVHDMILRVTTPPNHLVLPDVVDRLRRSEGSITSDTLLMRDDLKFVGQGFHKPSVPKAESRRVAYVFLRNTGSVGHNEVVDSMIQAATPLAITLLTAAVLVGRFDAVAEIAVERLNHLDEFVHTLRRSLSLALATVTYPTVRVLQETESTAW
jgi:hypothetical protein